MNQSTVGPFYFDTSARLVKLLGRESVSNSVVALCELIKNAWDADATEVKVIFERPESTRARIRVQDNGHGVNPNEFQTTWMLIATADKEERPLSRKLRRPKAGEKGVGRFATEKLARKVTVVSKPVNATVGFRVGFDWDKYESAGLLNKIENAGAAFQKRRADKGFEVILDDLRDKWDLTKMRLLEDTLAVMLPPVRCPAGFVVKLYVSGARRKPHKIRSGFLALAPFRMESKLGVNGKLAFSFIRRGRSPEKSVHSVTGVSCGPAEFSLGFYYRDKRGDYSVPIDTVREVLDRFGGLHLYRDGFRVNLDGDWAGLDRQRVNAPSNYPGNNQIVGFVRISRAANPDIIDTTTRQNVIENEQWRDLLAFIYKSIALFVEHRKAAEARSSPQPAKRAPRPRKHLQQPTVLLAFAGKYPWVFYNSLETEINACYQMGCFNACLVLSRKLVENLVYNLIKAKYPNQPELRWDFKYSNARSFAELTEVLSQKRDDFSDEQKKYLNKLLSLCGVFRRVANTKAHQIIEYIQDRADLDRLKIAEIVQLLVVLGH